MEHPVANLLHSGQYAPGSRDQEPSLQLLLLRVSAECFASWRGHWALQGIAGSQQTTGLQVLRENS